MTTIAEVLGWKFDHEPGIRTKDGMLIAFPGPMPTDAEIALWTSEYSDYIAKKTHDDPILEELAANDLKIIRALVESDTAKIQQHLTTQTALRAELIVKGIKL